MNARVASAIATSNRHSWAPGWLQTCLPFRRANNRLDLQASPNRDPGPLLLRPDCTNEQTNSRKVPERDKQNKTATAFPGQTTTRLGNDVRLRDPRAARADTGYARHPPCRHGKVLICGPANAKIMLRNPATNAAVTASRTTGLQAASSQSTLLSSAGGYYGNMVSLIHHLRPALVAAP